MEILDYDVVILGSGIAGFSAAVHASHASEGKARVAVISKLHAMRSHSVAAEGGLSGVLHPKKGRDTLDSHAYDTVKGSDFLADQDAVEELVKHAPEEIKFFEHLGVPWHREDNGDVSARAFGGMSTPRTVFAEDKTGFFMMRALYDEITSLKNVDIFHEHFATKLMLHKNRFLGIYTIDLGDGSARVFSGKSCIIATGGFSRIFSFTTTSHSCTGDGIALAYEAGLPLKDMEFTQFHPTAMVPSGILITEAARGEGGYLKDKRGDRFMSNYAKSVMELAPRDIVSRAIVTEIARGNGILHKESGLEYVNLDLRHLGEQTLDERLPMIKEIAMKMLNINPSEEQIPVRPAAHFTMGGIHTDIDGQVQRADGKGGVDGLWAAGEAGCVSVHGANRLGSNSLSQCAVWGRKTGYAAAKHARRTKAGKEEYGRMFEKQVERERGRLAALMGREDGVDPYALRDGMYEVTGRYLYVYRNMRGMRAAKKALSRLKAMLPRMVVRDKSQIYNTNLRDTLEINNLIRLADIVAACAMRRKESRGAHAVREHPKRDDANWLKHTLIYNSIFGQRVTYSPVKITKWTPVERHY